MRPLAGVVCLSSGTSADSLRVKPAATEVSPRAETEIFEKGEPKRDEKVIDEKRSDVSRAAAWLVPDRLGAEHDAALRRVPGSEGHQA